MHNYRQDRLVLVVPQGHPLAAHDALWFADTLADHHIALDRSSPLHRTLDEAARAAGQAIRYGIHVQSFDAVCRMVQAGLGIAVLPHRSISLAVDGPPLVSVALRDEWASRQFQIVSRPVEMLPRVCRDFLDFLANDATG